MLMLRMIRLKMTNAAKMDMTMPYWASVQPSSWSRMGFRMERIWSYSGPAFLFLLLASLPVSYILLIFLINFLAAPWLERPRRRNSLYAMTNRRLITIIKPNTLFITQTVRTYPIRKLKYVHQKLHRDGTGHLIPGYGRRRQFIIEDVPQPGKVADLLKNRIRKGIFPS